MIDIEGEVIIWNEVRVYINRRWMSIEKVKGVKVRWELGKFFWRNGIRIDFGFVY